MHISFKRPNLATSASEIHIEEKHKATISPDPQQFFLYDSEAKCRIIIFCSPISLKFLWENAIRASFRSAIYTSCMV